MPKIDGITVGGTTYDIEAQKLSQARTIDGVSFDGSANITHYGVCSTVGETAVKEVTISGFVLGAGARVSVKFLYADTSGAPMLNISGTGAKSIAPIFAWNDNSVVDFIYDGTAWQATSGAAEDISGKMDKANPSGTGAMSLNRAADSTVGKMSAVLGSGNTATDQFGISLGYGNRNDGQASLAAGSSNQIKRTNSTNSQNTVALGMSLQAQGNAQIVLGKHNKPMEDLVGAYPKYPLVFGWGTTQGKKNILLMDNEGNIDFAGSAKANGEPLAPYPCETVSGNPATTQIGADGVPVKSLEAAIVATQSGSGDPSPTNIRPISGHATVALTMNGSASTTNLGRTVYGGSLNVTTGVLTVTHRMLKLSEFGIWRHRSAGYFWVAVPDGKHSGSSVGQKTALCSGYARAVGGSHVMEPSYGDDNVFAIGSTVFDAQTVGLIVRDNAYTDVTTWLAAAGNYQLVYELAEPLTYQIDMREVKTVLGENSFSADTGDVTVTLRVDPTLAYNELKAAILAAAE